MGKVGKVFFLTKESAARKELRKPFREEFLDGKIGSRDNIFESPFFLYRKTIPYHQGGGLTDDVFNLFECNGMHIYRM